MQLATAGLLVIENGKLLLAYSKNKDCFYLPGGKIDTGETAIAALCREIAEELNVIITPGDVRFYTHITAPAYGEATGVIMEQDCFLLNSPITPSPNAEVGELRFFTLQEYRAEKNNAPGAVMILQQLTNDKLIGQ